MDNWDWKSLVKTIAPGIASVFGTPLAGMGISAILDAILPTGEKKPDNPEAYLTTALKTANPDLLLKLKEADQHFKLRAKELDIDLEKLELETHKTVVLDRTSARQYALGDTEKVAGKLTLFIAGAFSATLVSILIMAVLDPSASPSPYIAGLVGTVVGAVISEFKQMTAFHFGSNSGSARSKEMLFQSSAIIANGNGNGNGTKH